VTVAGLVEVVEADGVATMEVGLCAETVAVLSSTSVTVTVSSCVRI
jgi:hypothetical protein